MEGSFRNKNRGYQQLRVWQDAIEFYVQNTRTCRDWPFELKKLASQQLASADSVHRNIAEGYARRGLKEYLQHLYIALGSLAESVSGLIAYRQAEQVPEADFNSLNVLAYKLENGLLKLVESLELKQRDGTWTDSLILKDSNDAYEGAAPPLPTEGIHYSKTP